MKAYKFRIYPTKSQDEIMRKHLWIAKELWNDLLEHTKFMLDSFGKLPSLGALQIMVKGWGMFSQAQQEISHRIHKATMRFFKLRKKGIKVGFPRFKSFNRMKSLHYPQYGTGFSLDKKLKVNPFGSIKIKQHREINGQIRTLSLKRESTGKWFAIFTVEEPQTIPKINNGSEIGIDVGLKCFARLSDNTKIANPRHFKKYEDKLARAQRRLSKKKKGSRNRYRARKKVAIIHEKIKNTRSDFLHKMSNQVVNKYSLIGIEDLSVQEMAMDDLGKSINDAGWSMFARFLNYKAENAGSKVVGVDPRNTTKTCHQCHHVQDMPLSVRIYRCPDCGLVMDRDLNSSKYILTLARATLGHSGSNASGDGAIAPSLNEEAHIL
jgi:putative transposase